MRILFASAEFAPLAQSGGLGDAVSGLAADLCARGHEVVAALPAYRDLLRGPQCPPLSDAGDVGVSAPDGMLRGRWLAGRTPSGVELRLLDLPALFDRPGLYGALGDEEQARRFIVFARAAAELAAGERPDVVVAHDWHAALTLCCLRSSGSRAGTVQVVHNGAFIGRFSRAQMEWTGLPDSLFGPEGLEFYGDLCLLKGGLRFAQRIVAVSPRYARELTTPEFGGGLDGVYRARGRDVVGIVNGIDNGVFDPSSDPALPAPFDAQSRDNKDRCREALLDELGLEAPAPGRLLGGIGRLSAQKGWDVLCAALDDLVAGGASLVLMGAGDESLASALRAAADRHPTRVAARLGWDDRLARRLYAGVDGVLLPSRFEPCGLVQRIAQRYGALPIAHEVGGLADTIDDGSTGVLFSPLEPDALVAAVDRGAELFEKSGVDALRRTLLSVDVSWSRPGAQWERLLEEVAGAGHGRE